jgi:hypothetical protein
MVVGVIDEVVVGRGTDADYSSEVEVEVEVEAEKFDLAFDCTCSLAGKGILQQRNSR